MGTLTRRVCEREPFSAHMWDPHVCVAGNSLLQSDTSLRLSLQDISFMDDLIPATFFDTASLFSYCLGIFIVVAITSPLVIVFLVAFVYLCNRLRRFYSVGSRAVCTALKSLRLGQACACALSPCLLRKHQPACVVYLHCVF
jgi:hypothetical protein